MNTPSAMPCSSCKDLFSLYLDDELSAQQRAAFGAHLASCHHCAAEWNLFQDTLATLHRLEQPAAPVDLLPGIHAKLDRPALGKIRQWFSFMGHHKIAASTAMATFMVAVVSATILQLNSVQPDGSSFSQSGNQVAAVQAEIQGGDKNYYPGIPYLRNEAEVVRPTSRPLVQFASTASSNQQRGYHLNRSGRAPPLFPGQESSSSRYEAVAHLCPDITVTVSPRNAAQQHLLVRQLVNQSVWLPQIHGNTIHIKLPAVQLASLQRIFAPADPYLCQSDRALIAQYQQSGRLLNVAVTFQ